MDTNTPSGAAEGGAVAAPEGPAPGSEIRPGVFAPLKPSGITPPAKPAMFKEALDRRDEATRAAEAAAQGAAAATGAPPAGEPAATPPEGTPEGVEGAEGAEGAEGDPTAGDQGEGAETLDEALVVELPAARPEEEAVPIEVNDPAVAERLRQLVKGYARRQEAERIREEASQLRQEAEEINYAVELDPAGVVEQTLRSPADQAHLARYLLTQPGVLERVQEFAMQLLDSPDSLPQLRALAEAERIKRREHVQGEVTKKRELDRNAAQIIKTTTRSIETLVGDSLNDGARETLFHDVLGDLQRYAREQNLRIVDPRIIPGMVQKRLAAYGVAPKAKSQPPERSTTPAATPKAPAAAPTPPAAAVPPQKTGAQFTAARAARRAAAAAPPGVGAPVPSGITKPPPFDPKQPGTAIQQAANWARRTLASRRQGPQ